MSIRKALAFSFIDRYASLVIGVVSTMVLARLLTPADIGVFSITVVLLSFATTFRDFGAGQYLVQEKDLTPDRIRAVWTLQLSIGALLSLLAVAASGPVSRFYAEPRMRDIMWVLALSYLINPFGSVTYAWLMRTLRFDALATMRFSATVVGAGVSIGLAWRGWGPISLALGTLASIATNAGVSIAFRPRGFPLLPGLREVRRVLSFGTSLTSTSIIETVTAGAPELLLAKLQSLTDVGLFSRANGLVAMFARLVTDSVSTVAMSMFAKNARESGDFSADFLKANAYVTALGWSFSLMVVFLAHPLIRVLYGAQWDASVDLTRLLAVAMAAAAPAALCYQALLAAGAAGRLLRAVAAAGAVTVPAASVGAFFGLMPLGWALLAAALLATAVWLRIAHAELGFSWSDYRAGLAKSARVAGVSMLVPATLMGLFGAYPTHSLPVLVVGLVGSGAGFVAGALYFKHPIAVELVAVFRKLRARFAAPRQPG